MSESIQQYLASIGKVRLRRLIKEGARRNADRDLKLVEAWRGVDESQWRDDRQ